MENNAFGQSPLAERRDGGRHDGSADLYGHELPRHGMFSSAVGVPPGRRVSGPIRGEQRP